MSKNNIPDFDCLVEATANFDCLCDGNGSQIQRGQDCGLDESTDMVYSLEYIYLLDKLLSFDPCAREEMVVIFPFADLVGNTLSAGDHAYWLRGFSDKAFDLVSVTWLDEFLKINSPDENNQKS